MPVSLTPPHVSLHALGSRVRVHIPVTRLRKDLEFQFVSGSGVGPERKNLDQESGHRGGRVPS